MLVLSYIELAYHKNKYSTVNTCIYIVENALKLQLQFTSQTNILLHSSFKKNKWLSYLGAFIQDKLKYH